MTDETTRGRPGSVGIVNSRIVGLFAHEPPVIPFLTAGFPTRRMFLDTAIAAHEAGAKALEVGMPFSDPLADGPAIQRASQMALSGGTTLSRVLDLAASLRARMPIPIFLMGYLNPILRFGPARFAAAAAAAGVDGTIIPDWPPEEAGEWIRHSREHGLANVFLMAPTTAAPRLRHIDRVSTDFSYCVAVTGVTGARSGIADSTREFLRRVRHLARKPVVVGFGIAAPDHVRALAGLADGFVIGSALVPLLEDGPPRTRAAAVGQAVARLVRAARG
ncbi:MAG: tryptophan synthase subunit alpha [Candidatus Zixiibacteriota bacterium]